MAIAPVSAATLPSRVGAWRLYVPAVPATLAVLAAGAAFQRVFTWGDVAAPLVVSMLVGAAGGVAARQTVARTGPEPEAANPYGYVLAAVAVVAATLIASALTALVFASPSAGALGTAVTRGWGAFAGGWSRILTTTVPVPPTADRLPLAAGLVALAAGWAVLAATRPNPGVGALAPAGLVFLIALLLGVHGPGSLAAVAGPPLVLAAAYLLIVSRPAGEGVVWVPPGRVLAAVSTAAVVLALCLAVGDHLPLATLRQPVNLRNAVSPPVQLADAADPLNELPAWERESRTVMFTASVDQAWLNNPTDWRLVSLDAYDGTGWGTNARATAAGQVLSLPAGVSPGLLGPEVHVDVRLGALPGPWVPTAGMPTAVTRAGFDFDPTTSDLVEPGPSPAGLGITGRLSQPTRAALDGAGIGSGAAVAALTAVPSCFPNSLRALASRATAGLERPDQEAVAIEQELSSRGGFHLDAAATPGSNCARLATLASDRSGTAEQFATAFALMVRSVGLPSRIAVGFTPGAINPAAKRTVVTGSDATVWPEIDLGRLGWVAFDPVPSAGGRHPGGAGTGATTTIPATERGLAQVRQTVAAGPPATTVAGSPTSAPGRQQAAGGAGLAWPLIVLLALVAAAAGVLGGRAIARRRRRALRRKAADPARRLLGAWEEVLDALGPFRTPLTSLTPSEVSGEAERVVASAGAPSRQLAGLVDQAVYGGVADDGLAAQAWACSDLTVRALGQAVPPRRRIGALLVGSRRPAGRHS